MVSCGLLAITLTCNFYVFLLLLRQINDDDDDDDEIQKENWGYYACFRDN